MGRQLAHYRITALIGRGGFGEVYKAHDENLDRSVALKVLPSDVAGDAVRLERFRREARTVAGLNHPNIVTLHSIEEDSGVQFLTMELLEGRVLKETIPTEGHDAEQLLDLTVPLARALAAAHKQGVTHRDLKPANIMVDAQGHPKILDFGLAKIRQTAAPEDATQTISEDLTGEGVILGTVSYMAPEQVQGRPVDARTDIFSFGLVLYQMATGRRPFGGKSAPEIMSAILRDEPESIRTMRPDLPVELVDTIERCMRKSPDERFDSGRELAAALEGVRQELRTASVAATLRPARHSSAPRVAVAGVVLALVVAIGWYALRGRAPAPLNDSGNRIVVLPMDNLGATDEAYFAQGLTDEISSRLATVGGLGVVSRTTAVQYRDSGKSVRQIGDELDVQFVLEGSVRWQKIRDGTERIRVTSQLVRVADDTNVWTQSYDRDISDIFEVQTDIAKQVVEQLNLTLLADERRSIESRPTANMEAYRSYLQGLEYMNSSDPFEAEDGAIEAFERAVELDPEFALAWALLGQRNARRYGSGTDRSDELKYRIRSQIDRALELNADLPEAHMALGFYHYWVNLDYDQAFDAFKVARTGSPSNARILAGMAYAIRRSGDLQAAVEYLEEALRLDPRDASLYIEHALTFFWLRDHDKAMALLDRSIELDPTQVGAYLFRAEGEWYRSGDLAMARSWVEHLADNSEPELYWNWFWQLFYEHKFAAAAEYAEAMNVAPTTWWYTHPSSLLAGLAHRAAGQDGDARRAFTVARQDLERRILRTGDDRLGLGRLHGALGMALAGLGLKEEALRHGRQAVELHSIDEDQLAEGRWVELAFIGVMVGEFDTALDSIETLIGIPSKMTIPYLEIDPMWDPLRSHPRYVELVEKYAPRDGRR